jgi:hypothetical protein
MRTFTRNIAVDVLTFAIGGYTADGNINALGRFLARRIANRSESTFVLIVLDALDGLMNGLDYIDYVEMYGEYIDALEGDDAELACGYLDEMVYRCSDAEDCGYLFDMMAKSKHGDHYYAEYC